MTKLTLIGGLTAAVLTLSACQTPGTSEVPVAPAPQAQVVAQPLPAQGVPVPQYVRGERWLYSDGYGMTVVDAQGAKARFQRLDDPKQYFVADGIFREEAQSRSALRKTVFQSADPAKLYTAKKGEPVVYVREYTKDKALIRHNVSWSNEGTERVTVPAGTFDAIILTKRVRSLTGVWTGYERWWYVPAVKNYVRMEYKYGDAPDSARVLVQYTPGGQS